MSFRQSHQKQDAFCKMTSPKHLRKIGLCSHKGPVWLKNMLLFLNTLHYHKVITHCLPLTKCCTFKGLHQLYNAVKAGWRGRKTYMTSKIICTLLLLHEPPCTCSCHTSTLNPDRTCAVTAPCRAVSRDTQVILIKSPPLSPSALRSSMAVVNHSILNKINRKTFVKVSTEASFKWVLQIGRRM